MKVYPKINKRISTRLITFLLQTAISVSFVMCYHSISFAQFDGTTPVAFERIKINLPGNWTLKKDGKMLYAALRDASNTSMLFVEPVLKDRQSIQDYLKQGVTGFEKGRKPLQVFPKTPESGITKSGTGFAFWGVRSRGGDGKDRFSMYYSFSVASMYQTIIVLSDNSTVFAPLLKALTPSIDAIETVIPPKSLPPLEGTPFSFYNYSMKVPGAWNREEGVISSVGIFAFDREKAGIHTGSRSSVKCMIELQPNVALSPVTALAAFLENRAGIYTRTNKNTKFFIKKVTDGVLPNGQSYVAMMLESIVAKNERFPELDIIGGIMLQGPGSSLMIGAGHHVETYSYKYKRKDVLGDLGYFDTLVFETMPSMAASLRWDPTGLKRNQDKDKWLINKKGLKYLISGSASSMDGKVSIMSSKRSTWRFYTDRTAEFDFDRISSSTVVSHGLYNVPNYSSGYSSGHTSGKRASFEVWDMGPRSYIIMRYPSGLGTLHSVSFNPFEIDGFRDGCCK